MARIEELHGARIERLRVWNCLFHGVPVRLSELDRSALCGDLGSPAERAAYVTLRSCVSLANSSRQAIRCALRIAILYWFSNVGERRGGGRAQLEPRRSAFHLGEAIGTRMTWDETVAAMKRKAVDFSAYLRILEIVGEEYARQWAAEFPGEAAARIDVLAANISDTEHASSWGEPGTTRGTRRATCDDGGEGHV